MNAEGCKKKKHYKERAYRVRTEDYRKRKAAERVIILLGCMGIFLLSGCGAAGKYDVKIAVPAGSQSRYAYSEEEISSEGGMVTVYAGEGLGDTEVVFLSGDKDRNAMYGPVYLTPGMPVRMEVPQGEWFRVGVNVQNTEGEDITVHVTVKGAELRIP